jgi:pimeloyl-ACP methyl ester carboxylesterase
MLDEPMWNRLNRISVSTLIIGGENDNLIPNPYLHGGNTIDVMEYGTSHLPHSRLVMMPHAGHMVQMEASEGVNAAITEFCRAVQ